MTLHFLKESYFTTICFVSFVYSVFNEHFCKFKIRIYLCVLCTLVGPSGLEPPTNNLSLRFAPRKDAFALLLVFCLLSSIGRTKWTRTTDLVLIRHAL